jgi:hypothetical protein
VDKFVDQYRRLREGEWCVEWGKEGHREQQRKKKGRIGKPQKFDETKMGPSTNNRTIATDDAPATLLLEKASTNLWKDCVPGHKECRL